MMKQGLLEPAPKASESPLLNSQEIYKTALKTVVAWNQHGEHTCTPEISKHLQITCLTLPSWLFKIASTALRCKCIFSLTLLASLASLSPVSYCEELMMYQGESWERKSQSPRKISTIRSSQFTHPLSHWCVFRLYFVIHSWTPRYKEKHLVFTRRNQGFP